MNEDKSIEYANFAIIFDFGKNSIYLCGCEWLLVHILVAIGAL